MTYSITATDKSVTGDFLYMVKINDERWIRYTSAEEKTLEDIKPLIDKLLANEKEIEENEKQRKLAEEANLS